MSTLNKRLRAELGLEFTPDGTLATVDPAIRMKQMVSASYARGELKQGDSIKVQLTAQTIGAVRLSPSLARDSQFLQVS